MLGAGCRSSSDPARDEPSLAAVARSLDWLQGHPAPPSSRIGSRVLDAWTWERLASLHPEPAVRERAEREARQRLEGLGLPEAPDFVALSYWATVLRVRAALGLESDALARALADANVVPLLAQGSPTTGFWTGELLRRAGLNAPPVARPGALRLAQQDPAWTPSLRDAVAFYHEIAAASDLGRAPVQGLPSEEQQFARRMHPLLLAHVRSLGHTDAAAEVLIGAAILGQRGEDWIDEGIDWLLTRQRPDGSFERAGERPVPTDDDKRHGVLVVSWALLEHLSTR